MSLDAFFTLFRPKGSVGLQYSLAAKDAALKRIEDGGDNPQILNAAFLEAFKRMNAISPNYGRGTGLPLENWWERVVTQTYTLAQYDPDFIKSPRFKILFQTLYHGFGDSTRYEVFPEVRKSLDNLKGMKLAVISNSDSRLANILKSLELHHYFDEVVTSYEAGSLKPDPRIFAVTLKKLNVLPQEALHVGDDFKTDFGGASNARMHALLLRRRACNLQDNEISGLDQVVTWLEKSKRIV